MTDFLIDVYETSLMQKKSMYKALYKILFVLTIIILLLMFLVNKYYIAFMIIFIVLILVLNVLDQIIIDEKKKYLHKKTQLFYDIFYPNIISNILNKPFKPVFYQEHPWPYQKDYYQKLIHVIHDSTEIIIYAFQVHQHQKPMAKICFIMPCSYQKLVYLNHSNSINDIPELLIHHHYAYYIQPQDQDTISWIELIERCPHLLDVEINIDGQVAMFMCKIKSFSIIDDIKIRDKTFKKHQQQLTSLLDIEQYLKASLKEFEHAHRK